MIIPLLIYQEKALDEMELRDSSSSSELETDEEWEAERTRQMATALKDQV